MAEARATAWLGRIERGVLEAVTYADIFDQPLTVAEIHRYLGLATTTEEVARTISHSLLPRRLIAAQADYYMLPGREDLVHTRRHRVEAASVMWKQAIRYGALIGRMPFVRMVAVTGALALDNVDANGDIDFLVVTEPDRLWTCRALIIAIVRLAARRGHDLCPNFFVTERAVTLDDRSLFSARELAQMVPLSGIDTYWSMRQANPWTDELLPNAAGLPRNVNLPARKSNLIRLWEALLRSAPGGWFEHWEMNRKLRRFSRRPDPAGETAFTADICKGHFGANRRRIMAAFSERVRVLEDTPVG